MAEFRFSDFDPPIPFLTGDAAALHSIITEVDRVLALPSEKVEERQAHYLLKLIAHFWKSSEFFRRRCQRNPAKGDHCGNLWEILNRIEPKPKQYFQTLPHLDVQVKVPKHHQPTHKATTSGSTGVPLTISATAVTRAIGMAQVPWAHLASGVDFSWRLASVKPLNKGVSVSENWDPASSLLFDVGPMLSIPTSIDIQQQLNHLEEFRPDFLITLPNILKEYLSVWDRGLRKPLPLKMIRTMGETLPDSTRELAKELTGAEVLDTYSSSEVERIATQTSSDGNYKVNTYSLIVEILREDGSRCQPGEMGRVVVTDLMNYATPLIRYDIGDWAVPANESHSELRSILGRSRNLITLPNGKKIWPLVGYREFSKVIPVRQFHITQVEPTRLKAKFQVDLLPNRADVERVKEIIRESLGWKFEIGTHFQTEPLPKPKNGKLEDFVSLLP